MSDNIKNPVFVIGAPRSGTSILGRILENHSTFVHVREPRLIWKFGNDAKSDLLRPEDATPRVIKHIRKKFSEIAPASEGVRLLEKTPSNALRIPFILKIFPDAKFVHITRNGYDSAKSISGFWQNKTGDVNYKRVENSESILMQRWKEIHYSQIPYYIGEFAGRILSKIGFKQQVLWGPRLPGLEQMAREMSVIEIGALQWRYCVEAACFDGRKLDTSNYFELKLEELSKEKIKEVFDFLEMSEDPAVKEYFESKFVEGQAASGQKNISHTEMEKIKKWIEPTINWLKF